MEYSSEKLRLVVWFELPDALFGGLPRPRRSSVCCQSRVIVLQRVLWRVCIFVQTAEKHLGPGPGVRIGRQFQCLTKELFGQVEVLLKNGDASQSVVRPRVDRFLSSQ